MHCYCRMAYSFWRLYFSSFDNHWRISKALHIKSQTHAITQWFLYCVLLVCQIRMREFLLFGYEDKLGVVSFHSPQNPSPPIPPSHTNYKHPTALAGLDFCLSSWVSTTHSSYQFLLIANIHTWQEFTDMCWPHSTPITTQTSLIKPPQICRIFSHP